MGHLLPGDEVTTLFVNQLSSDGETILMMVCKVVEWQGRSLQSRSYEEVPFKLDRRYFDKYFFKVRDIIAACRQDRAIELVVSRDSALAARRNTPREGLGEADLAR